MVSKAWSVRKWFGIGCSRGGPIDRDMIGWMSKVPRCADAVRCDAVWGLDGRACSKLRACNSVRCGPVIGCRSDPKCVDTVQAVGALQEIVLVLMHPVSSTPTFNPLSSFNPSTPIRITYYHPIHPTHLFLLPLALAQQQPAIPRSRRLEPRTPVLVSQLQLQGGSAAQSSLQKRPQERVERTGRRHRQHHHRSDAAQAARPCLPRVRPFRVSHGAINVRSRPSF